MRSAGFTFHTHLATGADTARIPRGFYGMGIRRGRGRRAFPVSPVTVLTVLTFLAVRGVLPATPMQQDTAIRREYPKGPTRRDATRRCSSLFLSLATRGPSLSSRPPPALRSRISISLRRSRQRLVPPFEIRTVNSPQFGATADPTYLFAKTPRTFGTCDRTGFGFRILLNYFGNHSQQSSIRSVDE